MVGNILVCVSKYFGFVNVSTACKFRKSGSLALTHLLAHVGKFTRYMVHALS